MRWYVLPGSEPSLVATRSLQADMLTSENALVGSLSGGRVHEEGTKAVREPLWRSLVPDP
jgi:hypothetical protein